ncbi:MAG: TRAP transporter fused permease subunit [Spirochaetes bacterium]|nr:TRAP transporter fused permease subunit [Spirochaetota bacterium]
MSEDVKFGTTAEMTEEEKKAAQEIEERAREVERATSGKRDLSVISLQIVAVIAAFYSVFQIFNVFAGFTALRQRSIHLAFAMIICIIKFSANKNKGLKEPWLPYIFMAVGFWTAITLSLTIGTFSATGIIILLVIMAAFYVSRRCTEKWRIKKGENHETGLIWYDYVFMAFAVIGCLYIAIGADYILSRAGIVYIRDQVIGFFLILAVFEATRRSIGHILMFIGMAMLFYCGFGYFFPGIFWHPGFNVMMVIRHFVLTDSGIWSAPLGVSASYIAGFLLLGASLHASGLAEVMLRAARGIFGTMVGGPAKMTVIASTMFSLISGSSTSNVATTGPVTIPLMKKTGVPGHLAAGVEATASLGGQITPPVMGAVAFIMAEFLGVSYLEVCLAAALPALLYYTSVYSMIHFESHRIGAIGLKKSEIPPWKHYTLSRIYLFAPVFILVGFLIAGFTPPMAAFWAFITCCILAMFRKDTRLNPKKFFNVLSTAGQTLTVVAIPSAVAGFVVGTATLTGLTPRVAAVVYVIAQDRFFLTLVITQLMCLAIGMGVPTVANYILMYIITIPIMISVGVPPMAAHLFCFHFGLMSEITPPVAITSYTASAIAGAKFWPTTFAATRLAAVAYVVPYFFVFNIDLLLGQTPFRPWLFVVVLTAIFGTVVFASVMAGYQKRKLFWWERGVICVAALFLINPVWYWTLMGTGLFGIMLAWQFIYKKEPKSYVKGPVVDYTKETG